MPGALIGARLRRGLVGAILAAFALAFAAGWLHRDARPGDPSALRRTLSAQEGSVPAFDGLAVVPAIPRLRAAARRPARTSRPVADAVPTPTATPTPVPVVPPPPPVPAAPAPSRPEAPTGQTFDSSG